MLCYKKLYHKIKYEKIRDTDCENVLTCPIYPQLHGMVKNKTKQQKTTEKTNSIVKVINTRCNY